MNLTLAIKEETGRVIQYIIEVGAGYSKTRTENHIRNVGNYQKDKIITEHEIANTEDIKRKILLLEWTHQCTKT